MVIGPDRLYVIVTAPRPVNTVVGVWQVNTIGEKAVIPTSPVTLMLNPTGRVRGFSGCSQYSGRGSMNDEMATFATPASTAQNCIEGLASQERRLFSALQSAHHYRYTTGTALTVYNDNDETVLTLKQTDQVLPEAKTNETQYICEGAGVVTVRNVSEQVIELTIAQEQPLLSKTRSPNGSRYAGKEIIFHHHQGEALLEYEGQRFGCQQR
ncbi:META domain-containing protein [Salinimonas marina]|uniref:META domain-containing protein n=1 Tax=Salinimonas marina TaxID=2785918 RepID=A0A7S9DUN6_9ALTE|nr:META domain-containing protein [Salinimonas marina]QPG04303.1 META domain-containing protein [Salinimonas marina]